MYISSSTVPSTSANSIHVMKMCNSLAKLNKVQLITQKRVTKSKSSSSNSRDKIKVDCSVFDYYAVKSNFSILDIPWFENLKGMSLLYGLIALIYCKKNNSDLVISRNLLAAYVCSTFGIKTILELHSSPLEFSKVDKFFWNLILKNKKICKIVVISNQLKNHLLKLGVCRNIQVLHDGADIQKEQNCDLNIKNDVFKIGYSGSFSEGKGVNTILELARLLPHFNFIILGGNNSEIKKLKRRASSNITFKGYVEPSKVSSNLMSCNLVLLPNKPDIFVGNRNNNIGKWCSPLKAFEYMSLKKPIICSNTPSLTEVFENGFNCILCDPNDLNQWVKAIHLIKEKPLLAEKLAQNAYNRFVSKYTWDERAKLILDI